MHVYPCKSVNKHTRALCLCGQSTFLIQTFKRKTGSLKQVCLKEAAKPRESQREISPICLQLLVVKSSSKGLCPSVGLWHLANSK